MAQAESQNEPMQGQTPEQESETLTRSKSGSNSNGNGHGHGNNGNVRGVVRTEHLTAQAKHAAKLSCSQSLLHQNEEIAQRLQELKEMHLDGRLFIAMEMMQQLYAFVESLASNGVKTANANRNDLKESKEESIELIEELNKYPLIVDIRNKHKETLQMLELLKMKDGWHCLSEKDDWVCHYMQPKNTNTYSFRCVGVEQVPMFNLIALFYEMDLIHTWLPFCQESVELGQLAMYCKQGYVRISLYWPMNDRECVLYGYGVDDLDNGNILIFFDSRETEDVDIPKKHNSRVRVDIHVGGFYLERVSNDQTKVTAVFNCDPKTYVPYKLLNWFLGQFVANFLPKLLGAAKFEKDSPYLKRIAEKKDFYDRIKNKILRTTTTTVANANNNNNNDNDTKTTRNDNPSIVTEKK